MKSLFLSAALMVAALPLHAADLALTDAFARASAGAAKNGAAFVTIHNSGPEADRLLGAEASVSQAVELHTHVKDGAVMRMRKVEAIPVPANGVATLQPGGDHIMLVGLKAPLKEGETVALTLVFEKAGRKAVAVPVKGVGATAHPHDSKHHHDQHHHDSQHHGAHDHHAHDKNVRCDCPH